MDKIKKWLNQFIKYLSTGPDFFKEGTKDSMMRKMCLMLVRASIYYPVLVILVRGHIDWVDCALSGAFMATGITGKAQQKKKEKNNEPSIPDDQES